MKKGTWKKERATGRKYSGGDEHREPKAHMRKKDWVSDYDRADGKHVKGYFRKNPAYRR